eukprot:scaffold27989_cov32-Tisochrysis_lutea.AAC.1
MAQSQRWCACGRGRRGTWGRSPDPQREIHRGRKEPGRRQGSTAACASCHHVANEAAACRSWAVWLAWGWERRARRRG